MRLYSLLLGLLGLLFASPAQAQSASLFGNPGHWYVGVDGGLAMVSDYDMGFSAGGNVGFDFEGPLRAEVAVGIQKASFEEVIDLMGSTSTTTADLLAISALAYGIYDLELDGKLTPFAGAGLGMVRESVDLESTVDGFGTPLTVSTSAESTGVAFGAVAGVNYEVSPSVTVKAQGRYISDVGSLVEVGVRIPLSRK